ncbi:hypothetical protein FRC09_011789 [Ceratobasidium sp. 395]|nr:hypothetical protein FRC09_011789 [Ceratobasidium sp. 395]
MESRHTSVTLGAQATSALPSGQPFQTRPAVCLAATAPPPRMRLDSTRYCRDPTCPSLHLTRPRRIARVRRTIHGFAGVSVATASRRGSLWSHADPMLLRQPCWGDELIFVLRKGIGEAALQALFARLVFTINLAVSHSPDLGNMDIVDDASPKTLLPPAGTFCPALGAGYAPSFERQTQQGSACSEFESHTWERS